MTRWEFPRCVVNYVYDGDTIVLKSIDLGLDTFRNGIRVRFRNASAPELNAEGGIESRDHLRELVKSDQVVTVTSAHWDKYANRIDGYVYTSPTDMELGEKMIKDGFAKAVLAR